LTRPGNDSNSTWDFGVQNFRSPKTKPGRASSIENDQFFQDVMDDTSDFFRCSTFRSIESIAGLLKKEMDDHLSED